MTGKNAWKNFLGKCFVFRFGWGTQGYSYTHISWAVHIRSAHLILSLLLFNHSVMSLWPHGLQHTRLPRPSLSPRACSNSCLLSCWCHSTISSSVAPFSSWGIRLHICVKEMLLICVRISLEQRWRIHAGIWSRLGRGDAGSFQINLLEVFWKVIS